MWHPRPWGLLVLLLLWVLLLLQRFLEMLELECHQMGLLLGLEFHQMELSVVQMLLLIVHMAESVPCLL